VFFFLISYRYYCYKCALRDDNDI